MFITKTNSTLKLWISTYYNMSCENWILPKWVLKWFVFENTTKILPKDFKLSVLCGDNGHKRPIGKDYPIMKKLSKINGFQRNNGIYVTKGMGYKFEV